MVQAMNHEYKRWITRQSKEIWIRKLSKERWIVQAMEGELDGTSDESRSMSSSGWLLEYVEVDFIFIVAKVLINKLKELFKYKY